MVFISILSILSIGFMIMMDLLQGLHLSTSIQTILSPFRFMRTGEAVLVVMTLLYVLVLELVYSARKNR
jgi:hypothetical protein